MQLTVESCAETPSAESITTLTFAALGYLAWKIIASLTVRATSSL
jgi:hypothetical protein